MLFLDPEKPRANCSEERCSDCKVNTHVHCHFSLKDLIHFYLLAFPSLLLGGAAILHIGGLWMIPWVVVIVGYFGFVEIRVMCSHCPHYAEEGKSLKCWANYGSPKIWKYRPGPMNFMEKCIFFLGLSLIWGLPLYFLVAGMQIFLLLVYLLTSAGFLMSLKRFFCSQCMNFACPLNGVGEEGRRLFFACNPDIAKAWGQDPDNSRSKTP